MIGSNRSLRGENTAKGRPICAPLDQDMLQSHPKQTHPFPMYDVFTYINASTYKRMRGCI